MFDLEEGIEVRVQLWATKQTLGESRVSPQSPLYLRESRRRMIEAKTDQRFQIEVVVTKDFDFLGCRYVRALVEIDGGIRALSKHIFHNRTGPNSRKNRHSHSLSTLRPSNSGSWENFGFAFAELKQDDTIVLAADEALKEAMQRGKITVTLQRGSAICSSFDPDDEPKLPAMRSLKVSKKVIQDQHKTHSFKCVKGGTSKNPPKEQSAFTPAEGKTGEPIVYTFTYVSLDVLLANKLSKAPPANAPSKNVSKEESPRVREPPKDEDGTGTGVKRKLEIVDLTDVDEPALPPKIESSPVPANPNPLVPPGSQTAIRQDDKFLPETNAKPMLQTSIKDYAARDTSNEIKNDGTAEVATATIKDRARKKMKLEKELERLKIQLQINQREQETWEIDEE